MLSPSAAEKTKCMFSNQHRNECHGNILQLLTLRFTRPTVSLKHTSALRPSVTQSVKGVCVWGGCKELLGRELEGIK